MVHIVKRVVHQKALYNPSSLFVEEEEHLRRGGESGEEAVLRERRSVPKKRGGVFMTANKGRR